MSVRSSATSDQLRTTEGKYPPLIIKAKKGNAVKYSNNYYVIDAYTIGTNIKSIIFSEVVEIKGRSF